MVEAELQLEEIGELVLEQIVSEFKIHKIRYLNLNNRGALVLDSHIGRRQVADIAFNTVLTKMYQRVNNMISWSEAKLAFRVWPMGLRDEAQGGD